VNERPRSESGASLGIRRLQLLGSLGQPLLSGDVPAKVIGVEPGAGPNLDDGEFSSRDQVIDRPGATAQQISRLAFGEKGLQRQRLIGRSVGSWRDAGDRAHVILLGVFSACTMRTAHP